MGDVGWEWDPSLYSGSAAYYVQGRVPYTQELADCLAAELMLDGSGRLLDVGCGPGSLTLLLAGFFEHATGLDADPDMLAEAKRQAAASGITNVDWVNMRAEALTPHLGHYRVATLAQAFHWMDRASVARLLHSVLTGDGALVHLHATTHQGIESNADLPYPRPPRQEIDRLVKHFLGPQRRAGRGTLRDVTASDAEIGSYEAEIYRAAGFTDPTRLEIPGRLVVRHADDIVASVFSLSGSAPHLFGDRRQVFEAELRELLRVVSPDGRFSEQMRESAIDIWRA
ncbi:MAG: methyltransferase domain-containing protein [Nocardioidaceae bacterium]|nr:methyltransferase domain-containing protein [Nocardioidaceae bacterium]